MPGKFVLILSIGCSLGIALLGCSRVQQSETSIAPAAKTLPTQTVSGESGVAPEQPSNTGKNSSKTPETQAQESVSKSAVTQQASASRPPLTVEKLKNTEYFFLAKGPIKLTNGEFKDDVTQRTYTLSDAVAYGDINQDGIKDAVTALKVTIPNTGTFSYLVALVNNSGSPKNVSAEFMGAEIKVKTLKINSDNSIAANLEQYQAGDPECCPSIEIQRTYKLRTDQAQASP